MRKVLFILVAALFSISAMSQAYNNEWIDYTKTYYKFKVGRTGLYRITSSSLSTIGLSNEGVQNLQLWRNGKQVPLFTSAASGPIGSGYVEFWGEQNDGVPDKSLYLNPNYQISDKISLQTDTAAFFLTVNTTGTNLRYTATANNVTGNTLTPEPYFIYAARFNFRDRIHRGYAVNAGEYLYSSSYDMGEMWATGDISPVVAPASCNQNIGSAGVPYNISFSNLFVATTGPAASFRLGVAGSAPNGTRTVKAELNGTEVISSNLDNFNTDIFINSSVALSVISAANVPLKISTTHPCTPTDRTVAVFAELNYPRQYNFGNQSNFEFTLPASSSKYLEITNFNSGGTPPVLYDVTNNRRYVTELNGSLVRVVLQSSSVAVNFVLVSQASANVIPVTSFIQRNFVNYGLSANQADYIIISNSILQATSSGANQVDLYRAYRASATGGSYNAKIFDIDMLVDEFGFGIKKHPLSIKNFLRFVRSGGSIVPKYVFLVGKGVSYDEYRVNESSPQAETLNLVPTWGYPASDVLLVSNNLNPVMSTPVGRLSAVSPVEVSDYLSKVKQYEQAQQNQVQTVDNKEWMKTVVHVAGGNDPYLDASLASHLKSYEDIITDTLFGGRVVNFNKTSTGPVTPIVNSLMDQTFQRGLSLLTYFGHSSASSLDYNLDDPYSYNNPGKYPLFVVNGCNAGNLYSFDVSRFGLLTNLSEKWVLAKNRGSIGFIASTHFGLENQLDALTREMYRSMSVTGYGKGVANNLSDAINILSTTDFYSRIHAEETSLHGDPAIKLSINANPDFDIEQPQLKITPNIISTADTKFTIKAFIYNLGKATGDSVNVQVKRQYPDGTTETIFNKRIKSVRYADSITLDVPIVASRDKGDNKITVSVDDDNRYTELSELNNTASKTFSIFEDELKPVYPYNFSIINKQNIKLYASTANPVVAARNYLMELDTTELFNSPFKISKTVNSAGGLLEFDPAISFTDSTVYYWRVAPSIAGGLRWNTASFVYINGSSAGFNQSHFYQHTKSNTERLSLDTLDRKWKYKKILTSFVLTNAIYPFHDEDNLFSISINGDTYISSACLGHSILFNVFDPVTMKPYYNQPQPSTKQSGSLGGFMGSASVCSPTRQYNFEYSYLDTTGRRKMRDFMNWVPAGAYVTARIVLDAPFDQTPFANEWKNDGQVYGVGNTFYDKIKAAGFAAIDSFSHPRTWVFIYKKNDNSYQPAWKFSEGLSAEVISLYATLPSPDTLGFITSPIFGPAKTWKQVKWRGSSLETTSGDVPVVSVIGITPTNQADTLFRLKANQQDFDISSVSATQYPNIKLSMRNIDSISLTPYQLRYWRLLYDPVPEGALAPNISYRGKDTLQIGENLDFSVAFKNISDAAFADSMKIKLIVYDKNNVANIIPFQSRKKLLVADSINVSAVIDTRNLTGNNTLFLDVNPDLAQPEQYHSNNFLYKNFYVRGDSYNPLMDVTFDGIHILNRDIVAAKPKIVIRLKDEDKFLALDDTSLATVFVQYPGTNGILKRFSFGTDTLRFIPADLTTGKNEATIEFNPNFMDDSATDFYELIVRAKDKSGNPAGNTEYKVSFQVINKPMISNMFNYPNPFTTSTAFVFTLTGSEIPQNLRIQILTVTGKIVKDITKAELGLLHIGRNITEYKWDGTDQYGQKLANGIYLYRVITNLNGNSLDKFNTTDASGESVNTDKFFNKGYGKMYLMR